MKKRNSSGFTLIELLVVIAIVGILASVMVPNLLASRRRAHDVTVESTARRVLATMAATEIFGNTSPGCSLASSLITVSAGATSFNVNAPLTITSVSCTTTVTTYSVTVGYNFGSSSSYTETIAK
jgi:type IV pilus assembly protein PilA